MDPFALLRIQLSHWVGMHLQAVGVHAIIPSSMPHQLYIVQISVKMRYLTMVMVLQAPLTLLQSYRVQTAP